MYVTIAGFRFIQMAIFAITFCHGGQCRSRSGNGTYTDVVGNLCWTN